MNPSVDCKKKEKPGPPPKFLIGVRVRGSLKSELCDPGSLVLRVGEQVVVDTEDGPKIGNIVSNKIINFRKDSSVAPKKILRIAEEKDRQIERSKKEREWKATLLCWELIDKLGLEMNLSRVVFFEEMNKSIFYFTAEGRIDFRELVKQLAAKLRHRIEMRQVGVRDEAKAITGNGICGQSLCCSTFLPEFTPVTIRMAKDQGLALNPSKISGVCGRLMCCLQYEHDIYRKMIKELPKIGKTINTPEGPGKVVKNDILKQVITVRLLDDDYMMYYHLDELRDYLKKPQDNPAAPAS
ncbi:MAG: sporulation protein [Nitrospinaceae bacterium]|nr:sporulation protein [Nitrospinaceae bacterium]NIR55962.1 sporulation protein [Nitrospinaceae bacterium]NIS86405.1 sporulation protein [Nitrospinaceae bacterium]NIT83243.1 sporulation protein [Nitrospinaceae bacterium]NIU45450.1 sporulation protein [Nitrospinaceae bacterium]